jgi:hypothetical protein
MPPKTLKGLGRKKCFGDGRETFEKWMPRQTGLNPPTKTKIKRRKKAEGVMKIIENL